MKHFFIAIILIISISVVDASETYFYTDWFDYYPTGVETFRIQSEDRYYWYKEYTLEDGSIKKDIVKEYYSSLDGYNKIEESKKTFYRVNNGPIITMLGDRVVDADTNCIKSRCRFIIVEEYVPYSNEEPVIDNPKTFDNIEIYILVFLICMFILIRNNNLVLSNHF